MVVRGSDAADSGRRGTGGRRVQTPTRHGGTLAGERVPRLGEGAREVGVAGGAGETKCASEGCADPRAEALQGARDSGSLLPALDTQTPARE